MAIDLGLFALHVKLAPSEAFAVSKYPAGLGKAASPGATSGRTLRTQNGSGGRAMSVSLELGRLRQEDEFEDRVECIVKS